MKLSTASLFLFPTLLIVASCDLLNPENEEPETAVDNISGIWEMSGTVIYTQYCYGSCHGDIVVNKDTTDVTFEIELKLYEAKEDTIRILDLPGANKGNGEDTVFSEEYDFKYPKVYARISGSDIEIDVDNDLGKTYTGTGAIVDNSMTLNSVLHYKARSKEYTLEGVKIAE